MSCNHMRPCTQRCLNGCTSCDCPMTQLSVRTCLGLLAELADLCCLHSHAAQLCPVLTKRFSHDTSSRETTSRHQVSDAVALCKPSCKFTKPRLDLHTNDGCPNPNLLISALRAWAKAGLPSHCTSSFDCAVRILSHLDSMLCCKVAPTV